MNDTIERTISKNQVKELEDCFLVESMSKQGQQFGVVYPKQPGVSKALIEELYQTSSDSVSKSSSFVDVNLPPDQTGSYKNAEALGIKFANVKSLRWQIYDFELSFTNKSGKGFVFKDNTGDEYKCRTILNCSHYIKYNSTAPTISGIASM